MADTSSAWQSIANVPQGDPMVICLHKELHDHGQAIAEPTTTMNQLAKAQLQQVQNPRQVNALEGIMKRNADSDAQLASHNTFIRNLEVQLGQISHSLNNRPKGALPSDTVVNPKGGNNNHVMEVTTRSGRGGDVNPSKQKQVVDEDVELWDDDVPLIVEDALEQMSSYAKFMKDLVTKKHSMDCETINMTHQVSAIVHSMDPKLEDPGAFTIPCTIGSVDFAKALCDLGASINLIPYSPNSTEVCSFVDLVTAVIVDDTSAIINMEDPLEAVLLNMDVNDDASRVERVNALHGMVSYYYEPRKLSLDLENRKTPPTKPSIEEPPVLELKPLPLHLRYEFFGSNANLPVILSSCLTNMQVEATLVVLQK
ncbi:uncharacterized protein [Nicotiana sylvestris]|uniref:uncharacterized protein n=1 Tax=Nicotiana sylvestris TaxID=4096 RepID=UPI00388CC65E